MFFRYGEREAVRVEDISKFSVSSTMKGIIIHIKNGGTEYIKQPFAENFLELLFDLGYLTEEDLEVFKKQLEENKQ